MKDVMEAVGELVELLPDDSYPRVITPWQKDLLALAAAWHDAGFDDDEAQAYPTKEEYAVALMKEDIKSNEIHLTSSVLIGLLGAQLWYPHSSNVIHPRRSCSITLIWPI